jgi:hypothetical protein
MNHTTTPVILLNLNLPPEERISTENILLAALIPGPNQHKDLDTFLRPLVEEIKDLGIGIPDTPHKFQPNFTMKAHLFLAAADGPALADLMGGKKPGNSKKPCLRCPFMAQTNGVGKTHYCPHTPDEIESPRITENYRQLVADWEVIIPKYEQDKFGTALGISRKSILMELSSLHFPLSFPPDMMHCILQNLLKQIHELWGGNLKEQAGVGLVVDLQIDLDEDGEGNDDGSTEEGGSQPSRSAPSLECVIPKEKWKAIADIGEASRSTIPYLLGTGPRRIDTRWRSFKAMEWREWLCRDAVPIISGIVDDPRFKPYLVHFVLLKRIFLISTKFTITRQELAQLDLDCKAFVSKWHELYYQNDSALMRNCRVNLHVLLHLRMAPPSKGHKRSNLYCFTAKQIASLGPAGGWWAFPMERYIGTLKSMVNLMSNIDGNLANRAIKLEHLNHLPQRPPLYSPASIPPRTASFPFPSADKRMVQHEAPTPTVLDCIQRALPLDPQFPITYDSVKLYKKFHKEWHVSIGSIASQNPLATHRRDDSYIWWDRKDKLGNNKRYYGQVVIFGMAYTWDAVAVVKSFTSVTYDRELETVIVGPVMGPMEPLLVKEIGGMAGRIINPLGEAATTYMVGNWSGLPDL